MQMAKYLIHGSYTQSGVQGLIREGGTGRADAIGKLLADLGGSLEGFYFAFGDDDVYAIAEIPDHTTAAAISLAVAASGAVNIKTVVLLTPEEMDKAAKQSVPYRPPGA
jgi:uncharacterized protein with GYD domain